MGVLVFLLGNGDFVTRGLGSEKGRGGGREWSGFLGFICLLMLRTDVTVVFLIGLSLLHGTSNFSSLFSLTSLLRLP